MKIEEIIAIGNERATGRVPTFRKRSNQEMIFREYIDKQVEDGNLSKKDSIILKMASQEFGEMEIDIESLSTEIIDFSSQKIRVAKRLIGRK